MVSPKEILSIELGKFNSVFSGLIVKRKKADFRMIPSSPDQMRQDLSRKSAQTALMGAFSQASRACDLCLERGLQVNVASTPAPPGNGNISNGKPQGPIS